MRYTYLISNFVAIGLGLIFLWRGKLQIIKRIAPVLILLAGIGLVNGLAEGPALSWGIWFYNSPKTVDISIFGTLLETYLYCILVPIAIGSVAIILAERQMDSKTKSSEKSRD